MKALLSALLFSGATLPLFAQSVGVGTTAPASSAALDIVSTTKGLLIPRMNSTQRDAIVGPIFSMLIFNSDLSTFQWFNGDNWTSIPIPYNAGVGIGISGNVIFNTGDTNAADDLNFNSQAGGDVSGPYNNLNVEAIQGFPVSGLSPVTGQILRFDAQDNTWFPDNEIILNAGTGINITGSVISATGQPLIKDTDANTFVQTEANANEDMVRVNLGGSERLVLKKTTGGNTQLGLPNSNSNVFLGTSAGNAVTTTLGNTFVGTSAGSIRPTYTNCTFVGLNSDASVSGVVNSTALGSGASVNSSNKIRLGNTAITVIEGQVAFTTSDGRFKSEVRADVPGLDFIRGLRPVTYRFDYQDFSTFLKEQGTDRAVLAQKEQRRETGFIAQEVEALCQKTGFSAANLVHAPESEHDNYSLAYGQLVVPLVQAVQEQQVLIEKQQAEIEVLKRAVEDLLKRAEK